MDAGTVATAVLLLVRLTRTPLAGATPSRATTTGALPPAATTIGLGDTEASFGGLILSTALRWMPAAVTVIVTVMAVATAFVRIVACAQVLPAAMLTEAGTVAVAAELDRETTMPPAGALPSNQTFAVLVLPPATDGGDRVTIETVAGLIVMLTEVVCPAYVALSTIGVSTLTIAKSTENTTLELPAVTWTEVGATALVEFDTDIWMLAPPVGATPLSFTVALAERPLYWVVVMRSEAIPSGLTVSLADRVVLALVPLTVETVGAVTKVEDAVKVPES
jgi:hypothetical protein